MVVIEKTIAYEVDGFFSEALSAEFPTLQGIQGAGNGVTEFLFSATLSPTEDTDLDVFLAAYTAPKKFKIYQYYDVGNSDAYHPPFDINYKTDLNIRLTPLPVLVQGELQEVTYYAVYDFLEPVVADRYQQPILKVTCVYNRDALGFAEYRQVIRQWYYEDGTLCNDLPHMKITVKIYDFLGTIREGKRRRQNIIDGLMMPVLGMMIQTELANPNSLFADQPALILEARRFLSSCKPAIIDFVDDSSTDFNDFLVVTTESWLSNVIDANGTTIRQYIMSEIDVQVV